MVLEQKPLPILVPPEDLKYAQVCKKVVKGHVVEVIQHVVFGDTDEILRLFGTASQEAILLERFISLCPSK